MSGRILAAVLPVLLWAGPAWAAQRVAIFSEAAAGEKAAAAAAWGGVAGRFRDAGYVVVNESAAEPRPGVIFRLPPHAGFPAGLTQPVDAMVTFTLVLAERAQEGERVALRVEIAGRLNRGAAGEELGTASVRREAALDAACGQPCRAAEAEAAGRDLADRLIPKMPKP